MRNGLMTSISAVALLALAACGGGGSSPETGGSMPPDVGQGPIVPEPAPEPEPVPELVLPLAHAAGAQQAPIIQFGDELRVGTTLPPEQSELTSVATHAGAAVRYGRLRDGIGAAVLTDYLREDARIARFGILRFIQAPVVRFVEGTTAEQIDEIARAVQLLNANLPRDFQLTVDPTPVSEVTDAAGIGMDPTIAEGQILVEYDRREDWEITASDTAQGIARVHYTIFGDISTVRVWVDDTRSSDSFATAVHELIHALGRQHANSLRFPSTVMHSSGRATEGYVMHQLDREALLAVYSVLEVGVLPSGDIASALGSWEDESLHVRGDLDDLAFGASLRNGLVRPWALGPRPGIDLAENQELMGSASWSGRLLGLAPSGETVAGAAGLSIDLVSLSGDLDFASLESWAAAPGDPGTGAMWGDGDLNYDIVVEGNVFARTGGDAGHITGAFFGASHEGMGGTLVRDDLSAGFAGTR